MFPLPHFLIGLLQQPILHLASLLLLTLLLIIGKQVDQSQRVIQHGLFDLPVNGRICVEAWRVIHLRWEDGGDRGWA